MGSGKLRERLHSAWSEIRENLGRSVLQTLGVALGVASVLGGFSISDSQRRRAEELFARMGGLDKLNAQPAAAVSNGTPTALANANLGLRREDADDGRDAATKDVEAVGFQRSARLRVRSAAADEDRRVTGIGGDQLALEGYELSRGRAITAEDVAAASQVCLLGSEAAGRFFPDGDALGRTLRLGDTPVVVVGLLEERVFRFREGGNNIFRWRNRIVAVPASLVARRMSGDLHDRVDRVTFRLPKLDAMAAFSKQLDSLLETNHRLQRDFRLDDVGARIRREESQGNVYNLVFLLSGILALLGGGMVNVNIQLASLRERVREIGVRMAIGASGGEIFRSFLTEAALLTGFGAVAGLVAGIGFSRAITSFLGVPLFMAPASFLYAVLLAALFGFVFALFPAWKASRLSPMEALHHE